MRPVLRAVLSPSPSGIGSSRPPPPATVPLAGLVVLPAVRASTEFGLRVSSPAPATPVGVLGQLLEPSGTGRRRSTTQRRHSIAFLGLEEAEVAVLPGSYRRRSGTGPRGRRSPRHDRIHRPLVRNTRGAGKIRLHRRRTTRRSASRRSGRKRSSRNSSRRPPHPSRRLERPPRHPVRGRVDDPRDVRRLRITVGRSVAARVRVAPRGRVRRHYSVTSADRRSLDPSYARTVTFLSTVSV